MDGSSRWMAASLASVLVVAMGGCATQPAKPVLQPRNPFAGSTTIPPPEYGSTFATGNYRSLESDSRPGERFFHDAWVALQKGDVRHAISMYQVSASWAFKPAAYMLGLIYFRGRGVPVDRPLGTAWMRLAAERNTPLFVKARDAMTALLSKPQRTRSDELWVELRKTYVDAHALARATRRFNEVRHGQTGTRAGCYAVGSVKTLYPGVGGQVGGALANAPASVPSTSYDNIDPCSITNPYSPAFLRNPDNPMFENEFGNVTVGPLEKVDKNGKHSRTKEPKKEAPTPSQTPQHWQHP